MIITDQGELTKLCEKLSAFPYITIDTEFLREKTYYPKLCLVQVSDPDGNAAAIDPIDGTLDLAPLFDLFMNPNVLKVIHSGRQDLEIFYNLTGKVVTPFFDTQIAAMVCGYGDSIGYESLVRGLTGHSLDKSVQFTDWSKRPLSKRQIDYALGDVIYLAEIYKKLERELEKHGRTEWVFEEEEILANPETYQNSPERAWERIKLRSPKPKMLAILKELAAWREKRAQDKNLPRSWIMKDETLADMAAQMPETVEQLKKIRGVTPDMAGGHIGKTLLEIIAAAASSDKNAWPKPAERKMISPQATATIDILKMLLKIQASEHGVAAKLVADQDDIERIATEDNPDIAALKGWRFEVFGREAQALKAGEIAVGLKNSKITKYNVSDL
ncbi:MAG: ribonuclease D [Micavibrio sp.]|nr:ribonuclease D [Micavibrio sp.]MBK9561857.1 ribonuclease D [Micavibrio sp.]